MKTKVIYGVAGLAVGCCLPYGVAATLSVGLLILVTISPVIFEKKR
jgi:hypothetical protein